MAKRIFSAAPAEEQLRETIKSGHKKIFLTFIFDHDNASTASSRTRGMRIRTVFSGGPPGIESYLVANTIRRRVERRHFHPRKNVQILSRIDKGGMRPKTSTGSIRFTSSLPKLR